MADTKNYGLKGVGDDVQFGKAGGRFVFNTGASDFRATTDGTTLAHLQVLTPVSDTDAATKLYVDSTAQGLDFKESCRCATTATTGTYNSTGGTAGNGQLTAVAASIDGVTVAQGDRVLIKDHSTAAANGIYEVQATTTTLNRAADSDSDAEVTAGNFTFIEEGTVNADAGFVLQGPDPLTVGTGGGSDMNWVLFSTSSDIVAGTGLAKTGNVLDLDFSELTSAATIATADELIFQDGTVESRITVANFLADRDIVTATANGVLVRTANDTYASRTLTASAVAGDEGISIVNGDGVSGNPTIGLDILGQTNLTTDDVDDADELILYHSVAGGTEGVGNYAITATKLKSYMNAGTSATSITELNTTLAVSDSGTDGTLTYTADTTQNGLNLTIATGGTLTVTDLTNNDVLIAGTAGLIEDSGGNLTFDGTTLAVTGAATVSTDLTVTESVYLIEQAAAGADTATRGQIWVRDDAPNTLMFTDDAGNDFTAHNVLEIDYAYSSTVTAADPGAGTLRFDSVTIGSITTLYIDDLDNTARDNSFLLANLAIGDVLTFRSASDPADYIVASASSVTDSTGYWTIGLTLIHTGTIFTNGDLLRISVEWQSQGGTADNIVVADDSADTTTFPVFVNDATGAQAPKTDASAYTYNASTGQLAATSFIASSLTNNDVLIAGTSGLIEDSAGNLTFDGTTLAVTGAITVDEITIDADTISNNTADQPIIIRPNGTGSIIFQNGSSEEILELNDTASAVNGLALSAGATGVPPTITTGTGAEANIDIGFLTNGTGVLSVTAGSGNYEDNVTAADDIPNKQYVDDAVAATGGSGTVDTIIESISLATPGVLTIGAADGIPANCTILSTTCDITTIADTAVTITVGDTTNGAASYMAASENDPEVQDIYIADGRLLNGGAARQANATIGGVDGTVGNATIIITFRHA
jgi:hypothetical protein